MIKNGITPRFAEVGKIKIGGKGKETTSSGGKKFQTPVRFGEFVVTTTEKGSDGNYLRDEIMTTHLSEYNGGKDRKIHEIPIRLPWDSIDMNFFTSFQYYAGNKCQCRGDGETAIRYAADGSEKKISCNPDTCPLLTPDDKGATKCKVSGILSCQIPLGKMEVGGIYRFRTHSWNTVSAILAALEYLKENTRGILQGLPLKLKYLKKATQDHGNVGIVTIVLDGVEMMKMRELAFAEFESRVKIGFDMKELEDKARAAGVMIDTDDPADIEGEFYTDDEPEPVTGTSADAAAEALKSGPPEPPKPEAGQGSLL